MPSSICDIPDYYKAIAFFLYMVFEAWLGRTSKVKSGSGLELILRSAWAFFTTKGDKDGFKSTPT